MSHADIGLCQSKRDSLKTVLITATFLNFKYISFLVQYLDFPVNSISAAPVIASDPSKQMHGPRAKHKSVIRHWASEPAALRTVYNATRGRCVVSAQRLTADPEYECYIGFHLPTQPRVAFQFHGTWPNAVSMPGRRQDAGPALRQRWISTWIQRGYPAEWTLPSRSRIAPASSLPVAERERGAFCCANPECSTCFLKQSAVTAFWLFVQS